MEEFNLNNLEKDVSTKIETAKKNAILETHLFELENELDVLAKQKDKEAYDREDEIEKEILASSVQSSTLVEFKEVLMQIARMYGQSEKWATDMLSHENAHANVAESVGYDIKGYIVLFSKDELGRIVSVQPAVLSKTNRDWGTIEQVMKDIVRDEAPQRYGETISKGDEDMLTRAHLKLKFLERFDPQEVQRVKDELGDLWED